MKNKIDKKIALIKLDKNDEILGKLKVTYINVM